MGHEEHGGHPPTETEARPVASTATPGQAAPEQPVESSGDRLRRKARRGRLYLNAFGAAALLIYVVGLAISNTHRVEVDWVFGTSSPPLVLLVLVTAVLGWLLGLLVAAVLRHRTRAPKPS